MKPKIKVNISSTYSQVDKKPAEVKPPVGRRGSILKKSNNTVPDKRRVSFRTNDIVVVDIDPTPAPPVVEEEKEFGLDDLELFLDEEYFEPSQRDRSKTIQVPSA